MAQWADVPWQQPMWATVDEAILTNRLALLENCYGNDAGGHSRFPGQRSFVTGLGGTRTYLKAWRGNLVAVTSSGKFYRVDREGNATDVTGVPLAGGGRPIFDGTEDQLLTAAGKAIISLAKGRTEALSSQAPDSTHVAFIDGYIIAIEPKSGRFSYCDPGEYETWNPLSVFTADGKPDDLNATIVTPHRELLLCGEDSIEQFERLQSGDTPFFRRWTTGEGLFAPYTLVADKSGTYGINVRREFTAFRAQASQAISEAVALPLEEIDDWTDAWAALMHIKGQKFIILQMPEATSQYGNKGVTLLLDYGKKRWSFLTGWDRSLGAPGRWPGWSYAPQWGRHYIGVADGIAELDATVQDQLGEPMRVLARSGHIDEFGPARIDNMRMRFKRGVGASLATKADTTAKPMIGLRVNQDSRGFGEPIWRDLGRPGDQEPVVEFGALGCADTWQFEYILTDAAALEFVKARAHVERLSW